MILYRLHCTAAGHEFEAWFKNSTAFEDLAARNLLQCAVCGDAGVQRALMAPAIAGKRASVPDPAADPAQPAQNSGVAKTVSGGGMPDQMRAILQRVRAEVERHCDYVGPSFADEARRMHNGETEHRAIYGETTPEQAEALMDDGIEVARIPWVPRADG